MIQTLGINGLGRIGKLLTWKQVAEKKYPKLVINTGRQVGTSLNDLAHFLTTDSTYGRIETYLYGHRAKNVIEDLNEATGTMRVDGIEIAFLRQNRNPAEIEWRLHGVELVVDATGQFLDPTVPHNDAKGSLRGHLAAGAKRVILSAPFKIQDKAKAMPLDAATIVHGINETVYRQDKHWLVSGASCTTTCLAYMIKPLLDKYGIDKILSASMAAIHAGTSSQPVLDRAPKTKANDLRKNRSAFNNIILTSTGATKALGLVIPEMKNIGFMAESVRVPVTSGSLIILNILFRDESTWDPIRKDSINQTYLDAQGQFPNSRLVYSEKQNVSADIVGYPQAAAVIEGQETHTRTSVIPINGAILEKHGLDSFDGIIEIPVTQAVIYGWYDNELGSYVHLLSDLIDHVAEQM